MRGFQSVLLLIFSICLAGCNFNSQKEEIAEKIEEHPNIILILADDYGIMDSQAYAHKFTGTDTTNMYYETPNIDRLVRDGVAFSQAYANQLCSPTRASILTGKYAAKLGFTTAMPPRATYYNQNLPVPDGYYAHDVLEHKDDIKIEQALVNGISNSAVPSGTPYDTGEKVLGNDKLGYELDTVESRASEPNNFGMVTDEISIAEALTGYHSAFIGKWHIGGFGAAGYQPSDQGFEALAWFDAGGSSYFDWKVDWDNNATDRFPKILQNELMMGDSGKSEDDVYLTKSMSDQVVSYIKRRAKDQKEPFFLYFSHFAVHAPYEAKAEDIAYFENKKQRGWNGHKDPIYASMVKSLDRSVGSIMETLRQTGLDENTLIIFMSDNGGIDSKITPQGDGTDNSPFLGGKACLTEGGIRVPLVFYWKDKLRKGEWVDVPVDCTDIYPTILEVAGLDADSLKAVNEANENFLDGQSLVPLLTDTENVEKKYSKETRYWYYPFNVIYDSPYEPFPLTPHSAIRSGDYKLIFDWYGQLRLYNIENDPYESDDLATKMPELKDNLFKELMDWTVANVAPRYWPSLNSEYDATKESRDTPFKDMFSEYSEKLKQ